MSWRLLCACALLAACAPRAEGPVLEPGARHELVHTGPLHEIHVSNPSLAAAPDGALHLAWSRRDASGTSVWAARAGGEPVRVDAPGANAAASHDAPGLAVAPDGRVHVLWTARRAQGTDLLLSTSRDGGASFGPPLSVAGAAPPTRDFASLAAAEGGLLLAAWLDLGGPVATARVARVDPAAGRVADETVLDTSACVCCRTAVAGGESGAAGVLWRGERAGSVRDMFFALSTDGGRHFAAPVLVHADGWALDACPHRGGALAFDAAGRAAAAWYTEGAHAEPSLRLARADAGGVFGAPRELHPGAGAFPDRVALALAAEGPGLVAFESATAVRREVVARAFGSGLGPALVLSRELKASGPAAAARPGGGFAAAWNEEAFPTLRSVVLEIGVRTEVR